MEPKPSFRWKRAAAWTALAAVILAFLGYFTASMLLNSYLRGEAFRALLNAKTSALFAAEGAYAPIQRQGFSFYADNYAAKGLPGTVLRDLGAEQIRAEFEPAAVFHGAWRIGSLQIQRLHAAFTLPGASPTPSAARFEVSPPPSPAPASARRAPGWVPDRFELRKARIEEAVLTWGEPGAATGSGSLRGMRLTVEPDGADWSALGLGGTLEQAGLPALRVDHVKLRYRAPDLFLNDSLLERGETERFSVSGQAALSGDRAVDLQVQWNGVPVSGYLPEDWRAGVKGAASGEARVTGAPGALKAVGTLRLTGGQLEALPILEKIAAFTHTREFRQFALQKAEADFTWTPQKLAVSRFVAESEGLIRAEGPFTVERGNLRGVFQVGVTPSCLRWLPGSRARVFTQERDGYVWTAVQVSGPLSHLTEDLTPRLTAAAGAEVIEGVKGTLENGAKGLFDLIKPLVP
ncbi:MAG: hypothetical protein PHQ12_13225 [Chthoniobacteraceae bacterium]|nr:hypothetical protein [Chthoniobacteraceae bacterium]